MTIHASNTKSEMTNEKATEITIIEDSANEMEKSRLAQLRATTSFIAGLRELARMYEENPTLPLPEAKLNLWIWTWGEDDKAKTKSLFRQFARAFGDAEKNYAGEYFHLTHRFGTDAKTGGVVLDICTERSTVCTPKVVGTKIEPAQEIPAQSIPERTIDIIEWECLPLGTQD